MLNRINQNPEVLFILSVLFYWVSTSNLLNPVALVLMALGLVMLTKRFKPLAVGVGFLYMFINVYLILALISEFREFPAISTDALLMLGVGGLFIALNLFIGFRLILNNVPTEGKLGQMA